MIEAIYVVRDEDGYFIHPVWDEFVGDREVISLVELDEWAADNGCKVRHVFLESTVDEDSEVWQEYYERGGGCAEWPLLPPSADAVLLSVNDTEDSPMQLWAVPAEESAND